MPGDAAQSHSLNYVIPQRRLQCTQRAAVKTDGVCNNGAKQSLQTPRFHRVSKMQCTVSRTQNSENGSAASSLQ